MQSHSQAQQQERRQLALTEAGHGASLTVQMQGGAVSAELGTRFSIERSIGQGSMGEVYRGRDHVTGHALAVKILRGAGDRKRFLREAEVLATLVHPHIVRYVGHGVSRAGEAWIAMEWLEGEDLHCRMRYGAFTIPDGLVLAKVVSRVLGWLHMRGLVHRDLKPSNVFLVDGHVARATLLDFGIARAQSATDLALTPTGALIGTPEYMAPEQVTDAKRVDARADVFALGCLLYHVLTGRSPFDGPGIVEVLHNVLYEPAPSLSSLRPDAPRALDELLAAMMAKSPSGRPSDATVVADCLDRLGDGEGGASDEAGDAGYGDSITTIRVDVDTIVSLPPGSESRARRPVRQSPPPGSMTRILKAPPDGKED